MQKIINVFNQQTRPQQDLTFSRAGIAQTMTQHTYGPALRKDCIIHIILSGSGTFISRNQRYHLHRGQGFVIFPDEVTFYQADKKDPWKYLFFSFSGQKTQEYLNEIGLNNQRKVFQVPQTNVFEELVHQSLQYYHKTVYDDLQLTSLLYQLLAHLSHHNLQQSHLSTKPNVFSSCTQKAIQFMARNFHQPLSVQDISQAIGFDRSYLTKTFKKDTTMTPKVYLTRLRVDYALDLLSITNLDMTDIASQAGFASTDVFIRTFKNLFNITPKQFQKSQIERSNLYNTKLEDLPPCL